ncbi:hypothetical protein IV102_23475 [bacterium]|nr:hypothetical protein [bacterium]
MGLSGFGQPMVNWVRPFLCQSNSFVGVEETLAAAAAQAPQDHFGLAMALGAVQQCLQPFMQGGTVSAVEIVAKVLEALQQGRLPG